jgi:4-carboxymuconolactone decarboxylase
LVTLVCARHWEAPYPWSAHVDIAMDAGLSDASLVAVREQLAADTVEDEEERLVLILVRSLLETGTIGDAEFAEGVRRYGEQGMIELVTSVGFYSTAAFVANTFQVPVTAQPRHGGLR